MVKVSVPNFFRCPISLEFMRDPVTLSTGRTYDRVSIERWFETGHNSCPSTMQVLSSKDVAPNLTLQRLIRQWCAANDCFGRVDLPTRQPRLANPRQVKQALQEFRHGENSYNNLKRLRILAKESHHENKKVLLEARAVSVLGNFVFSPDNLGKDLASCELALGILVLLPLEGIRHVVHIGSKQLTAISWLLCRGSLDSRVNAALLLASLTADDTEMKMSVGATAGVFEGLVQLLKEDLYTKATDASLKAAFAIISDGPTRNKLRAVDAGLIYAVAELLSDGERRCREPCLSMLELLCWCEEGREAASTHALIVPLLVRIISLGNTSALESALSCLWTLCYYYPKKCADEAVGQAEILIHLSHLIHSDHTEINSRTRQIAMQLHRHLRQTVKNCEQRFQIQ